MKIRKSSSTMTLPDIIAACTGTVSMVFEDGTASPLNSTSGTLAIFQKLWRCTDFEEVDIICDDPKDICRLLVLLSLTSNDEKTAKYLENTGLSVTASVN